MSEQNVELVRRAWDVFMWGLDQGNPGAPFDEGLFSPTSTLTPIREVPGSKTYVGRAGLLEFLQAWIEDFEDWKAWPVQVIDAGDDRVVATVRQSGRGKQSGTPVENEFSAVYTVADGQIVDQRHFLDPAEALDAAADRPRGV